MALFTYNALSLGPFGDLDRSDGGNTKSEQSGSLVGETFGSAVDPLYLHEVDITYDDANNNNLIEEDLGTVESISYPGSSGATLDSTITYTITITYIATSGLPPATIDVLIIQDSTGELFLIGDGIAELEAGGIESITIDAVVDDDQPGLPMPRTNTNFICFARGTLIDTDRGQVAVEDLCIGDLVQTRDNGLQPLGWIGSRRVTPTGHLAPVVISRGALGNSIELVVSPQHRILMSGAMVQLMFGTDEALVPAVSLMNGDTIYRRTGGQIEYFHLMCADHEILRANGIWTESLFLGPETLKTLTPQQLDEIEALFPERLHRNSRHVAYMSPSRIMLKNWEGRLLI